MLVDVEFPISKYSEVFDKINATCRVLQSIQTHTRISILTILVTVINLCFTVLWRYKGIHQTQIYTSTHHQVLPERHLATEVEVEVYLRPQSASLSRCQAPIWDPRPIFLSP
jgi:hypothetical protein